MGKIAERQAMHLQTLLAEKGGIQQNELAAAFGFSTTTVNRWIKGKALMRADSAKLIHEKWPEYSVDWLQGATEEKDPTGQMLLEIDAKIAGYRAADDAIQRLLRQGGIRVEKIQREEVVYVGDTPVPMLGIKISGKKKEVTITDMQWGYLKEEIAEYICLRASKLLERGCW